MRRKRISETIGNINGKYVEEAIAYTDRKTVRHGGRLKWVAVAVSCAAVLFAGILLLPRLSGGDTNSVLLGGLLRPYREVKISGGESGLYMWPWEDRTICEKYLSMTLDGRKYVSRAGAVNRPLSEEVLGEVIGSCEAEGYDDYTDKVYHQTFEVRRILGVNEERLVAADMEGEFYVFMHDEYNPPATFGDLLESYNLSENLKFSRFTLCEGMNEKGHFRLENDDAIWQILSGCQTAENVDDNSWNRGERNYISFTATSETLGAYKKVFYVTEDGYVWTNVFNWAYLYHIGEEAAGQIIEYATENGNEAEIEPYTQSLAGTVVEIGEDYILVDDSILCEDPEDGMVFRVPADDQRIRRYIDRLNIEAGDTIVVQFTGEIDVEAGNVVKGAYYITEATIAGGDVWVAE